VSKCFTIYDKKKCVVLIIKFGVGAKNLKSVSESLDSLAAFVRTYGVDEFTEKDCQQIAKLVDSGDKGVRENSLQFIGELYKIVDENIWRLVGNISIKVRGLLEGRFKQVKKAGGSTSSYSNMTKSIPQTTTPTKIGNQNPMVRSMIGGLASSKTITPRNPTIGGASKLNSLGKTNLSKSINQFTSSINSNNAQVKSSNNLSEVTTP
jgi:hypothetical protein